MTRTYDTGLTLPFRTRVRNETVDLLAPLVRGADGGFLRAVVKLGGTLRTFGDGEGASQIYTALLGRAPAIAVALGDRDLQPAGTARGRNTSFLNVHVYFVNTTPRSMVARVEADVVSAGDGDDIEGDDTADPGLDAMMEAAEQLLTAQRLGSDTVGGVIKSLELKREEELLVSPRHTLWQQVYLVQVTRTINMTRGAVQKLVGIDTLIHPPDAPASPADTAFSTELEAAAP